MRDTMQKRTEFFEANAGYGYDPKVETPEEGRHRCAVALAEAEDWANAEGVVCDWFVDPDIDSSEFDDSAEPWALWCCQLYTDPESIPDECLGGIDFGPSGSPWGDDYRRVVEAELALGAMQALEPA